MGLKHHTVIFVPHARARFRKWRITNRQLALSGTTLGLLVAVSVFTTWSFFSNTIDRQHLARLEDENESLRLVNQDFESSVHTLQKQLQDFEERTRELAIVAGLEGTDFQPEPGIGGGDPVGYGGNGLEQLANMQNRAALLGGELDTVRKGLDEQLRLISSTPAIAPVKGILTSGFGWRSDPVTGEKALHRALDISTRPGRPVRVAAGGIVVKAERSGRLGNVVIISHGYGLATTYGHLARIQVEPGQAVERYDTIGIVGNTGRTTGYHLHYEVRLDGKPVNPLAYILDGVRDPS